MSSPVICAGGGRSHCGVSFVWNEPKEVLRCNQAHILSVLLSEVTTVSIEVPKKHHVLLIHTHAQQHLWSNSYLIENSSLTLTKLNLYLRFPHLFHILQDIIQCIKLLSGVGRSSVLRYEDKLLYSWIYRLGLDGRREYAGKWFYMHKNLNAFHYLRVSWESWVSDNWPVLGALKRTTKGSLEKASTSPGRLSGYWYWAVTVTVLVLQIFRQTQDNLDFTACAEASTSAATHSSTHL